MTESPERRGSPPSHRDRARPASVLPELAPGQILDDKYKLVRKIGRGGMGVVFEATHLRLRQPVAIKVLSPEAVGTPDALATSEEVIRFEREARAASSLRSPYVARVLDIDATSDGLPYMVMELLEGRELAAELALNGPLPVKAAVAYVLQACHAMAEAHGLGIVHRDLKPSNLFIAKVPGGEVLKVLDFGISKMDAEDGLVTLTSAAFGTPHYMSPEQLRSTKDADARTDIWSLGVILFELLTGQTPFRGDSATAIIASIAADPPARLGELRPGVRAELERALQKAIAKDLDARYATIEEFAEAIAPFAAPLPSLHAAASGPWPQASADEPTQPARKARAATPARRTYARIAIASLVAGLLGGLAFAAFSFHKAPSAPAAAPSAPLPAAASKPTSEALGTAPTAPTAPSALTASATSAASAASSAKQEGPAVRLPPPKTSAHGLPSAPAAKPPSPAPAGTDTKDPEPALDKVPSLLGDPTQFPTLPDPDDKAPKKTAPPAGAKPPKCVPTIDTEGNTVCK